MEADLSQATEAELLQLHLSTHIVPCPVCGDALRTVESGECVACGARLRLGIGSTDLRLRHWIGVIVGLSMPLGLTAVFSVGGAIGFVGTLVVERPPLLQAASMLLVVLVLWCLTIVTAALLLRVIRHRRRFWRLTPRRQLLLAAIAILSIVPVSALTWGIIALLILVG
jgi:hypothetical protein